ncbi:GntR family transcriptional regulator [Neobacillus muris]|uniref:GntR family transcriptional regulator n=1 Tax=Neobacillus muris TaxID=2941334 RepID=UPI00203A779D|nr:GntR family transcriptional regulator [Neobacillus muris]
MNDLKSVLNHNSPIPLHHQLTEFIRKELLIGHLVDPSGKLPTEHELSEQFQVSRITVRSALKTLMDEGLLDRKRGSGTFLKTNQSENWIGELKGFSETIEAMGNKPGARVIKSGETLNPSKKIIEHLRVNEIWELRRLRFADGEPIAIEHSYFPKEIGQEIGKQNGLNDILTYQYLEQELHIKLHEGKQMISAVNATRDEAEMLNISEGEALLYMERLTISIEGSPIEFLQSVYRPDYFQYEVKLNRRG